jgi:hypothetical protein
VVDLCCHHHDTDAALTSFQVAPDIDIDALKKFSSMTTFVDYAAVHGLAQPNDAKSNSVLNSQFLPDYAGVLHRVTTSEQKLEKVRDVW